ncbi:T9SS type A sorting domain-containing protein [candidate division KSB1 bacterium]|nr:T9SS type A sorting domain-containing protein [bacterium]NUM68579.1 T9SS type A sorting domain-containing protein [candidate division KSB1 bacterium]
MKTRNALALFTAALLWHSGAPNSAPAQSWQIPIHVQIETYHYDLYFGVHPNAAETFNAGIDTIAPPPAFTPYAAFVISTLPGTLRADFRGPGNAIVWHLQIFNAVGKITKISWDSREFPRPGGITLNDSLDMLTQDSTLILSAGMLAIEYTQPTVAVASPAGNALPEALAIDNYPNPFAAVTRFEIRGLAAQPFVLRIFNVLGQEIRRFAASAYEPSPTAILWDGADTRGLPVANGVYFYRLELPGAVFVKRIHRLR